MKVIVKRFHETGALRFQLAGPVAIITMNRPRQKNALTRQMWQTMGHWVTNLPAKTRILVVRGAGEEFTAGSDIGEFSEFSADQANDAFATMEQTIASIERLQLPTIAAIRGPAFGAGFILSLACDIRIGSERAKFGMPVGKLGITLQTPFLRRLIQALGPSRTMDLVYTARTYDADEAFAIGLLNYVTSSEQIDARTIALCRRILAQSRASLLAVKENVFRVLPHVENTAHDWVDRTDFKEGVQAFIEKRSAHF